VQATFIYNILCVQAPGNEFRNPLFPCSRTKIKLIGFFSSIDFRVFSSRPNKHTLWRCPNNSVHDAFTLLHLCCITNPLNSSSNPISLHDFAIMERSSISSNDFIIVVDDDDNVDDDSDDSNSKLISPRT
ncbi:MAG: hypothetical protein ACI8RD_005906, partial [Bacillariaceae sp.]|jgi:hypothetical protein